MLLNSLGPLAAVDETLIGVNISRYTGSAVPAGITSLEDPQSNYDLNVDENLPDADEEKGVHIENMRDEGLI